MGKPFNGAKSSWLATAEGSSGSGGYNDLKGTPVSSVFIPNLQSLENEKSSKLDLDTNRTLTNSEAKRYVKRPAYYNPKTQEAATLPGLIVDGALDVLTFGKLGDNTKYMTEKGKIAYYAGRDITEGLLGYAVGGAAGDIVGNVATKAGKVAKAVEWVARHEKVASALKGVLKGAFIGGEAAKGIEIKENGGSWTDVTGSLAGDFAGMYGFEKGMTDTLEPTLTKEATIKKVHDTASRHKIITMKTRNLRIGKEYTAVDEKPLVEDSSIKLHAGIDKRRGVVAALERTYKGRDIGENVATLKKFITAGEKAKLESLSGHEFPITDVRTAPVQYSADDVTTKPPDEDITTNAKPEKTLEKLSKKLKNNIEKVTSKIEKLKPVKGEKGIIQGKGPKFEKGNVIEKKIQWLRENLRENPEPDAVADAKLSEEDLTTANTEPDFSEEPKNPEEAKIRTKVLKERVINKVKTENEDLEAKIRSKPSNLDELPKTEEKGRLETQSREQITMSRQRLEFRELNRLESRLKADTAMSALRKAIKTATAEIEPAEDITIIGADALGTTASYIELAENGLTAHSTAQNRRTLIQKRIQTQKHVSLKKSTKKMTQQIEPQVTHSPPFRHFIPDVDLIPDVDILNEDFKDSLAPASQAHSTKSVLSLVEGQMGLETGKKKQGEPPNPIEPINPIVSLTNGSDNRSKGTREKRRRQHSVIPYIPPKISPLTPDNDDSSRIIPYNPGYGVIPSPSTRSQKKLRKQKQKQQIINPESNPIEPTPLPPEITPISPQQQYGQRQRQKQKQKQKQKQQIQPFNPIPIPSPTPPQPTQVQKQKRKQGQKQRQDTTQLYVPPALVVPDFTAPSGVTPTPEIAPPPVFSPPPATPSGVAPVPTATAGWEAPVEWGDLSLGLSGLLSWLEGSTSTGAKKKGKKDKKKGKTKGKAKESKGKGSKKANKKKKGKKGAR